MKTLRALAPHLRRYRGALIVGLIWLLVTNLLGAAIPWLLKNGIDAIAAHQSETLVWCAVLLALAAAARGATRIFSRLRFLHAARFIEIDLRRDLLAALLAHPAPFFDRHRTGNLLSRFTSDLANVRMMAGFGVMTLVNTAMLYVITLALLLHLSPQLTLFALLPYGAMLLVVVRLSRRLLHSSARVQEAVGKVSEAVEEAVTGQAVIRAGGFGAHRRAHFDSLNTGYLNEALEQSRLQSLILPVMAVVGPVGTLLVLAIGGWQVTRGTMTLGELVAFNTYLAQMVWPTLLLGWVLTLLQRSAASTARLETVLDVPPPLGRTPVATPETAPALRCSGLTFGYGEEPVLHDLTLEIPAGTLLGIAGTTGCGKTTLLRLLGGLYPLPDGQISVGGTDLARLDGADHRRRLAVVPQEGRLFSGTLRDNLLYAAPELDDAALAELARRVGLSEEVARFPDGFATRVGEGGLALSGGQRQRVCLGRALARGGALWLLDDPLNHLDAATARSVWGELRPQLRDKTVLLASSRVSLLAAADRVALLDGGRLVALGSHAELLQSSPLYARLAEQERLRDEMEALA